MRNVPNAISRVSRKTLLAFFWAALIPGTWVSAEDAPTYEFNMPARDLDDALRALGATSDIQILFSPAIVRALRSAPLHGRLSATQALGALLANTNLTYTRTAANVYLVTQAAPAAMPLMANLTSVSSVAATAEAAAPGKPDELAEIIVTAGKRDENLQNIAGSVLVVTGSVLDRANVRDFDDIVKVAPSVTITKTSQPGNNSINIRGIGTYAYSIATEPSVAVVIDDVPQAFQAAAFGALVDVQRVEVLRGPQSTLFGKSASAGVINITTQQPTDTFSARLDALTTDDGEHRFAGTFSGPLTETLKLRLAANSSEYRGNVRNLTTGNWLNGTAETTIRGKLVWTPDEDWTVTFSPYYLETDVSCCAGAEYFVSPGSTTGGAATGPGRIPMSQFLAGITPGAGNRVARYGRRCARRCASTMAADSRCARTSAAIHCRRSLPGTATCSRIVRTRTRPISTSPRTSRCRRKGARRMAAISGSIHAPRSFGLRRRTTIGCATSPDSSSATRVRAATSCAAPTISMTTTIRRFRPRRPPICRPPTARPTRAT